jgi:hypothetical protein
MSENSVIGQALTDCGYMHVPRKIIDFGGIHCPLIFKATWSSKDVEHFIYVGKDAKGGNYFVGQFGVRAPLGALD